MNGVQVVNRTGVPQMFSGRLLPKDKVVEVDLPFALRLRSMPGYEVRLNGSGLWYENGQYYLYFLAPFNACDGYGSQAEDLALTWEELGVKLTARHLYFLNPFGLQRKTLEILEREISYPTSVGLCYSTPGEFEKLPTEYRVGLTMYESSDPRQKYPQWTHQINEIDLLLTPSEWCADMWRRVNVYTPIKVVELSASRHFMEAPLAERQERREFIVVTWATMTPRKSPLETIEVFQKAFPARVFPQCKLMIKTRLGLCGALENDLPRVGDERVKIISADWTFGQMVEWARGADVAIFLSKGEGSGRPGREALALGLPSIITDNTGYCSICKSGYVTSIRTHHAEPSPLGGEWYIPDWKQAEEALQWHYFNQEEAWKKAADGATWYRKDHAMAQIGKGILEAMHDVTARPSKMYERSQHTWGGFYDAGKVKLADVQHLQQHHARFFEYIVSVAKKLRREPAKIKLLEVGIGTGSFYAALHKLGFQVEAIEKDEQVIKTATAILKLLGIKPVIRLGDVLQAEKKRKVDICYHQGLLEHFSNKEIIDLLQAQFRLAKRVIFSVPSVYYPTRDFGNERLLTLEQWREVLRELTIICGEYYGGDGRFHVLLDVTNDPPKRGFLIKELR